MTDSSLLYLQLVSVEQKGWLTLRIKDQNPITAPALIGHISQNSIVVLSSWQSLIPSEKIVQAEFRYIENSGIYTLVCNQVEACTTATNGIRIQLLPPYEMSHRQQRNFIRIEPDGDFPLSFTPLYPDDYAKGAGIIKDMSGNGLRFVTDEFVHKDSILKISFPLPESGEMITGVGQVVRKEFIHEETITSVRFLDLDPEDQKKVIAYCVSEQLRIAQNQLKQRRKFARITLETPITVNIRAIDQPDILEAQIVNLGGGGLFLISTTELPESPLYHVSFHLPSQQHVSAYTKVIERTISEDLAKYHLEFVDIQAKDQELIVEYVLDQQLSLIQEPPVLLSSNKE